MRTCRQAIACVLILSMTLPSISCGLLLHPERRGQPPGRLDPAIVILDATGLLFFLVPGLIAFAVDFGTGTIYLPPEQQSSLGSGSDSGELVAIHVPPQDLSRRKIEEIITARTGRPCDLDASDVRVRPLQSLEEWTPETEELVAVE